MICYVYVMFCYLMSCIPVYLYTIITTGDTL